MSNEIRVKFAAGKAGRQVAARIQPGTDLIAGIEKVCQEKGILGGWVNCIGSLQKTGYFIMIPNNSKLGSGYGEPNRVAGPVELISAHGLITGGTVHIHGTMCDKEGTVFGGHMLKDENPALATVELVINEILDIDMVRKYDEEADGNHFSPEVVKF